MDWVIDERTENVEIAFKFNMNAVSGRYTSNESFNK